MVTNYFIAKGKEIKESGLAEYEDIKGDVPRKKDWYLIKITSRQDGYYTKPETSIHSQHRTKEKAEKLLKILTK